MSHGNDDDDGHSNGHDGTHIFTLSELADHADEEQTEPGRSVRQRKANERLEKLWFVEKGEQLNLMSGKVDALRASLSALTDITNDRLSRLEDDQEELTLMVKAVLQILQKGDA